MVWQKQKESERERERERDREMTVRVVCVKEGRGEAFTACGFDVARFDWAVSVSWPCVGVAVGLAAFLF